MSQPIYDRQRRFFGERLPKHHDENLFHPLAGEDLRAFQEGDGKELESKMRSPISSAALCVNFFRHWKETGLEEFLAVFGPAVFGEWTPTRCESSLRFESKHRFGTTPEEKLVRGRSGSVDVDVRLGQGHAVLVESKFTEASTVESIQISDINMERYCQAFGRYFDCDAVRLTNGARETKCWQRRESATISTA